MLPSFNINSLIQFNYVISNSFNKNLLMMLPSSSLSSSLLQQLIVSLMIMIIVNTVHGFYNQRYYPSRYPPTDVHQFSDSRLQPYLEKPFQRLCLTGRYQGFSVGRSDDGKYCYYVCPTDPRFIPVGQVNYLCCSANYVLDYQTRICARINNQINHQNDHNHVFPSINHNYPLAPARRPQWNQPRRPPQMYCKDGMVKSHPYDCQRYFRCLFNFQFVEMKCPFNFGWNPHWKMCDPSYRCNHLKTTTTTSIYNPIQVLPTTTLDPVTPYHARRRFKGSSKLYSSTSKPRPSIHYGDGWSRRKYSKQQPLRLPEDDNWDNQSYPQNNFQYQRNVFFGGRVPIRKPSEMFKRRGQNNGKSKHKFGRKSLEPGHKTTSTKFWKKPWYTTSTTMTESTLRPSSEVTTESIGQIEIDDRDLKTTYSRPVATTSRTTEVSTDTITTNVPTSTIANSFTEESQNTIQSTAISITETTTMVPGTDMATVSSATTDKTTETTTAGPELPTQSPLRDITTTTVREPLVFEENSACYEPTSRYKDDEDCQCFYECELNKRLTRNCCPDGLFFNQLDYEPSINGTDLMEESAEFIAHCDLIENVDCKTIIQ